MIHAQPDAPNAMDTGVTPPSKTQRKKTMLELQAIGEELVSLSREQLAKIALPETLLDAVLQCKRITKHEARRRQGQYIGRLMRDTDAGEIRAYLDQLNGKSTALTAHHHRLERWRDQLIADDAALEGFAAEHPGCDIQHLRQLVRNARKERDDAKPPRAFRQLFQVLKEHIPAPAVSPTSDEAS
ncbi:MAG: ribosome biogenesis factor YjgA [Burkholderiales bacterium]